MRKANSGIGLPPVGRMWWRTIENAARCVSERMLELAEVEPGQRVLDIATGIGEPALLAASRVGSAGRVVATDISSRMLDIARERAAMSGVSNVEFRQADAGQLDFPDGSFDAVFCRWGVTSLPNPPDALAAIRRMLAPGWCVRHGCVGRGQQPPVGGPCDGCRPGDVRSACARPPGACAAWISAGRVGEDDDPCRVCGRTHRTDQADPGVGVHR
ncbi:class I SAM-dependent methyltransferase [Marilutibacter alkalisoli]|uniref:Methyltransferase domain-containing protein n=1 Tax=Marilutibacter alkalisoli TaxID=2591633 RepID=A0A514BSH0_9GAMM|nr:methyltransferase domain-containing protein [Lysobacter alkalisoli]